MAKWKMAGQMAVAMREAERQAEQKRIRREQWQESLRNGTVLRSLQRGKEQFARNARIAMTSSQRQFPSVQAENVDKTWDARVASSAYFQRQDTRNKEVVMINIRSMDSDLHKMDKIKTALDVIEVKERDVDRQIEAMRQKLWKARLTTGRGARVDMVAKRMQVAHQRYGLQLAHNRSLVAQIHHLQDERDKVAKILNQLRLELDNHSKQLGVHIEEAQSTYDQRDMNERNMVKLKDHMQKSSVSYTGDMQLLQFKIDVLKRMELFMITKNKSRSDEGRERRREQLDQMSSSVRDIIMLKGLISKIHSDLSNDDLHSIVKTYTELEQENYALFKNVSETRDLCHNMQVEIEKLKQSLAQKRNNFTRREREVVTRKAELTQKIEICKREAEKAEQQVDDANEVIATYIRGVLDIVHKLNYTQRDIRRLAGVYRCIEERNIRVFMAEIERHVNDLYNLKTVADYSKWLKARWMSMSMTNQQVDVLPPRHPITSRVVVVPPQLDLDDDTEDPTLPPEATVRSLSWDEMNYYVRRDITSRAQAVEREQDRRESSGSAKQRQALLSENNSTTDTHHHTSVF